MSEETLVYGEGLNFSSTAELAETKGLLAQIVEIDAEIAALNDKLNAIAPNELATLDSLKQYRSGLESNVKEIVSRIVVNPEHGGNLQFCGLKVSVSKATVSYAVDERILRADADLLDRLASVEVDGHDLLTYSLRTDVLQMAIRNGLVNVDELIQSGVLVQESRKPSVRIMSVKNNDVVKSTKAVRGV